MPATPQLVLDDPWLEPHQGAIERRMQRLETELKAIETHAGSLTDHARAHAQLGVQWDGNTASWHIREWAPAAQAISLIGNFNDWQRDQHPLTRGADGVWHLELPAATLSHAQKVKLHIVGADGSRRDRIPACIRRAVQDPESHDFCGQIWHPEAQYRWQHEFDPSLIDSPLIYESHVGMAGEEPRLHSYREFADAILPRVAKAG